HLKKLPNSHIVISLLNRVVTEDKYGSTVPIEETLSEEDDKKKLAAQSEEASQLDEDLKFILLKRPKVSIFGGYKVNTKAAHNHFLRYSDVKLKEETTNSPILEALTFMADAIFVSLHCYRLRKPTIVPYNDGGAPSSQAEKPGSPRSDTTTLSAPQSGQNSPKPPSDAGSQSNDQVAPSTTPTTTQEPPKPADPSAPVTVKKEQDDRKPTIQDLANQKGVAHRLSGWRVQHIAAQMDELNTVEQEVLKKLFELRDKLPRPRQGQKPSKFQDELLMLDELIQGNIQRSQLVSEQLSDSRKTMVKGNIQRSQLVSEQLSDSRKTMVKVLEHRPRCVDIIQKYINKRNPKKKS
ncbi:predicted protein, partial [Nematostella vectensis]